MLRIVQSPPPEEADEKNCSYYDRIAQDPKRYGPGRPVPTTSIVIFGNMLSGSRVLDVGCGSAWYADFFQVLRLDYCGIDHSTGMLKRARDKFPGLNFQRMNYRTLEFSNATFDGLWYDHGLDNVPKKEVPGLLAEFHRVLKPNGVLMVSVPIAPVSSEAWYYPNPLDFPEEYLYHALWQEPEVSQALINGRFLLIAHFIEDRPAMTFLCRRRNDDLPM